MRQVIKIRNAVIRLPPQWLCRNRAGQTPVIQVKDLVVDKVAPTSAQADAAGPG
jgi:hypothetical protein